MPDPAQPTSHRARKPRNVPLIVAICIAAALALVFSSFALVLWMQSGTPAANKTPLASPTSSVLPTPESPSPTGINPTDHGTITAETPAASSTPSAPTFTPKPLNFGNGSGCDTGKDFDFRLEAPVSGSNAMFKGTVCLKKGESIWAFNFDRDNSLYFLVSGKTDKPAAILTKSGIWNWTDTKIDGNMVVNFFRATQECSDWIAGQDPNNDYNNQIVLNKVQQHGCQVVDYLQIDAPAPN